MTAPNTPDIGVRRGARTARSETVPAIAAASASAWRCGGAAPGRRGVGLRQRVLRSRFRRAAFGGRATGVCVVPDFEVSMS